MGLTFPNTKCQHLNTRAIDMFYIFVGHRQTKNKGIFHSISPFKEKKNQHRTLHLDFQRLGQAQYNKMDSC